MLKISVLENSEYKYTPKNILNNEFNNHEFVDNNSFLLDLNKLPPKCFKHFYGINTEMTLFCLFTLTGLTNNVVKCFGNLNDTEFTELSFHSYYPFKNKNTIPISNYSDINPININTKKVDVINEK